MIKHLNSKEICIICYKPPEEEGTDLLGEAIQVPLLKHHVSYFPEVVAYVHYNCHKKIHDTPLVNFIQYKDGDSRKFYEQNKKRRD